jgi:DNA-binding response OmpR family regulator
VATIALLTDRTPAEVLPALAALGVDVKVQPLSAESVAHVGELSPVAVVIDAVADPHRAHRVLEMLVRAGDGVPLVPVVAEDDLERLPWHEVADDLLLPDASAAELHVRLSILARRTGDADGAVLRLGPLAMNVETYQVSIGTRPLDLTFKEFELLRFLIQRPGRVFTRSDLLQEVWGYNFYGGTRTVDVHVRRLRAKLGPDHEGLIETVRGVGYRAAAV